MTKTVLSAVFMATILLTTGVVAFVDFMPTAEAAKSQGTSNPRTGSGHGLICGDRLCSELSDQEKRDVVKDIKSTQQDRYDTPAIMIIEKAQRGEVLTTRELNILQNALRTYFAGQTQRQPADIVGAERESGVGTGQATMSSPSHDFGTVTSVQDPGIGHEGHQLAIILPPSEDVYFGRLGFSASEPVQYVVLHGPLAPEEIKGQKTWSPDGETVYGLTFVDNGLRSGGYFFAGNALALHTMGPTPFTATYDVMYTKVQPGLYNNGIVASGTVHSSPDPGIGHEGHSLAIIIPPTERPFFGGIGSYTASEDVQLVVLRGPLEPGEDKGQSTWTPDGETVYALTLVDLSKENQQNGRFTFSGNALALHTMNPDGFTATYSIGAMR